MKISIITLFPEVFSPILNSSILGRAQKKKKVSFEFINLRDFGEGLHKIVDDKPFGGGVGMVLKPTALAKAWRYVVSGREYMGRRTNKKQRLETAHGIPHTILMSAAGTPYKQQKAKELSKLSHLIIVCGHYEGVDQRFIDKYVDEEISIGDYVLTGGEIPAMAVTDSIVRLLPQVLEKEEATINESFEVNLLEYPQYTRPQQFEGEKLPEVLISGNHQKIKLWRHQQSLKKTKKVRPDLIKSR